MLRQLFSIGIMVFVSSVLYGQEESAAIRKDENGMFDSTAFVKYSGWNSDWNFNQKKAKDFGLHLDSITVNSCFVLFYLQRGIQEKIKSIINTDSTLILETNLCGSYCRGNFLCDISLYSSSTLNLNCYHFGHICQQDMCYSGTFYFKKNKTLNNFKAVMLNKNRKTIRHIKK